MASERERQRRNEFFALLPEVIFNRQVAILRKKMQAAIQVTYSLKTSELSLTLEVACGWGRRGMHVGCWWESQMERDH
jgi:hypothetical protein